MKHETVIMGHSLIFKTWTYGMKQKALRKATSWKRGSSRELEPDINPWLLNDMMLVQTLVEWDIVDEKGKPLPITLETIHDLEPPELVEEMISFTQSINGVSVEERKK